MRAPPAPWNFEIAPPRESKHSSARSTELRRSAAAGGHHTLDGSPPVEDESSMRTLLRASTCVVLLLSAIAITSSCGSPATGPADAGGGAADSGSTADSGTSADAGAHHDAGGHHDAGMHQDGGAHEDAGSEADAGVDAGMGEDGGSEDGGTDGGIACGADAPILYQVVSQGIAISPGVPSCYTSPADCDIIFTERFTDQAALDTFYMTELQETAPTVNFNLAEVLVSYSCACPTFGYTLKTTGVSADACTATMYVELNKPGEDCFTQQTFTRPFSTVTVVKDAGTAETADVTPIVYSCN